MAFVALVVFTIGATRSSDARTNAERIDALAKEMRCLQCAGETVFESRASFAENVKNEIARLVADGRTDDEVRATLVAEQGDQILMLPNAEGTNSLLWVLPIMVLVCGGAGLFLTFRRWAAESAMTPAPTESDRALVDAALRHGWVGDDTGTDSIDSRTPGEGHDS
jgi:cytochrome c-type biogenesis protein CcmH